VGLSARVLDVAVSALRSMQMGNVKHTRVLFFWNDSFRDLSTLTHSFVL
jgi:hypothetical protein